ncbi:MAG: hypothetical protein RIU67_2253 [Actinomycetota bacterium]|jgi:glycolate oxidase FAD binding subunit
MDLTHFAGLVGNTGPVSIRGLDTRMVNRLHGVAIDRVVTAPSGVVEYHPDEMTITCGAGTSLEVLRQVTSESGQFVALPGSGTVGGALAVGRSGIDRLGVGPVRDVLLQATFVNHRGELVDAGGPTVKNVSGFDVARLLVGSFGRLGFMARVILRTRPIPEASSWFATDADWTRVTELQTSVYRPAALLWNGRRLVVRLDGHPDDIAASARRFDLTAVDGPPIDGGDSKHRWSVAPGAVPSVVQAARDTVWAEVGVGIIHHTERPPHPRTDPNDIELRLLDEFDPERRLNPDVRFPQ